MIQLKLQQLECKGKYLEWLCELLNCPKVQCFCIDVHVFNKALYTSS